MSGNKPFAGPRVALPSHFPKSFRNSQPDNQCRNLIPKLLDQSISSSDFFTQLLSIKNENREMSFSILNNLLFYILNCKPYHSQFCSQFTALFTKLIQNPSEPVRRSVLPLISILINNDVVLKSLSNEFDTWKDESKEIFLSFAFCFQPPEVFEWKPFLVNAKQSSKSENESLSCTANDFIEYMNYFLGKEQNEPKVRNSLDLTKEQFRRSMSFRNSMEFRQNQMNERENYDENEEEKENENENESSDQFAIDNYFPENNNNRNKNISSARSSQNSEIKSLRVSKQKSAMAELEADPFNQKSPFFDSIENDQSESSSKTNVQDEDSYVHQTHSSKPQVIDSVDLTKFKNENVRKSSKNQQPSQLLQPSHRSKTGSSSKLRKETTVKSSKNVLPSSIDIDVEIDDTNIEIEEVGADEHSNSSSNLSGILDDFNLDLPSQLPKNITPQKSRQSQDRISTQNDEKKQKQQISSSSSLNKETQKKNGRTNQSAADIQASKPLISKSKYQQIQQKSSKNKQAIYNSNGYGQYSEENNDNDIVSFASQPARPPSARRGRQNNSSNSSTDLPKKNSQLNFVDADGVEETANSGNRISSKQLRKSDRKKKSSNDRVEFDVDDEEDDDEYSDNLFGAAPESKVTFLPSTNDTKGSVSSSANFVSNRQSSKKKLPKKTEGVHSKSGNSKTMSPAKKRPDSRGSNSSAETRQSPSNSFNEDEFQGGNVYSLVTALGSKDWEKQQKGVEGLRSILTTKPTLVSSSCREAWLNLLDVITSPRSMLANSALQLAAELFTQFSPQLVPQTALFVDICLNLCCNSRQFIADAAENVIILIAQESPRAKVMNSFVKGTGHKNSIARGKAAQCLAILIEQSPLDDREFKSIVKCLAPLVRDNTTETRFAAKETLKLVADDERFRDTAKDVCKNSLDYKELLKSVDL